MQRSLLQLVVDVQGHMTSLGLGFHIEALWPKRLGVTLPPIFTRNLTGGSWKTSFLLKGPLSGAMLIGGRVR